MAFRTERDLDRLTLPAGKSEVFHFDARCPGLSVRIQRTGKPAFVAGTRRRAASASGITLGAVAGIELDDARRIRQPTSSTPRAMAATLAWSASRPGRLPPKCSRSAT